jgi:HEAT repeat protein
VNRRFAAALAAVAFVAGASAVSAVAQEVGGEIPASREAGADLDRVVERANHQNPYLAAQAAKVLEARGAAAMPAVLRFVERRSIYALSAPVTTWLGELEAAEARALLERCAFDREFPWRPYAVRALAARPRPVDRATFLRLTSDLLTPVRESAAAGLGALPAPPAGAEGDDVPALRALLADVSFDVRAAAAESLAKRGDLAGVPVMLGALDLTRRFFDLDFGELARRRAWNVVLPVVGEGLPFEPGSPPEARRVWIEVAKTRWAARAAAAGSGGATSRPEDASWPPDVADVVFGLEVRSCRRGDEFLRLTAEGELVAGQYDLRRGKLSPEAWSEIRQALETVRKVDPNPHYGRPGCDFERYYLPDEGGLLKITVGNEGRPAGVRRLSGLLLNAMGDLFGDSALSKHLDRVSPFASPEEEDDGG